MPPARRRATRGDVVRLTILLLLVMAMLPLERTVGAMRLHYYLDGRHETIVGAAVLTSVHVIRSVVAGLLIDAYGSKRIVALALVAWCVLALATGFTTDPFGLEAIDLLQGFAFGPFFVGFYVPARQLLRSGRFGLPIAIVDRSASVWILAVPVLAAAIVTTAPGGDPMVDRQWQAMCCATLGALVTFVWLVFFREAPRDDDPAPWETIAQEAAGLMKKRLFLIIVVVEICAEFSGHISYTRPFHFLDHERGMNAATLGASIHLPEWIGPIACLIAAGVSDRMVRLRLSLDRARRPFLIGGFLLTATIGLLPLVRSPDLLTMVGISSVGYGLIFVSSIIVLDVAPPRYAGTIVGTLLALDAVVKFCADEISIVVFQPARSYAPILVIAALIALVGAFVTHRWLRGIAPLEAPQARTDLTTIF